MAVKKAVQSGNVEDAIEKVNDLNPEVRIFYLLFSLLYLFVLFSFTCYNLFCVFILHADTGHQSPTLFPSPTAAYD